MPVPEVTFGPFWAQKIDFFKINLIRILSKAFLGLENLLFDSPEDLVFRKNLVFGCILGFLGVNKLSPKLDQN